MTNFTHFLETGKEDDQMRGHETIDQVYVQTEEDDQMTCLRTIVHVWAGHDEVND